MIIAGIFISLLNIEYSYSGEILMLPGRTSSQERISIDPLSLQSLYLDLLFEKQKIGSATGFIVKWKNSNFLITSWHVLSGRNSRDNKIINPNGRIPDEISIWNYMPELGRWSQYFEKLYNLNKNPLWIEHPKGRIIDVVALLLRSLDENVKLFPFDLKLADTDMQPEVGMPVFIIGFPEGMTASGKLPIWKTGHIASEPNIDYNNTPSFLIDATTRGGMSGSPVVLKLNGGYRTKLGGIVMASSGFNMLFLGVYSSRFTSPEIGLVWKPKVIIELFENYSTINNK